MTAPAKCPKCRGGKLETLTLSLDDRSKPGLELASKTLELDQCAICGGVWFDKGELDKYLDARGVERLVAPEVHPKHAAAMDANLTPCPRCPVHLDKAPLKANPKVRADACHHCGGLWIDGPELEAATGAGQSWADKLKAVFGT